MDLPVQITILENGIGGYIEYVYDATGTKLQKTFTETGVIQHPVVTQYAGNYIYENNVLKQITQPEGYIEPNGSSFQYVYRFKDIWNNTRITYADDNGDGTISQSEIRREQNYYPFGLKQKGYNNVITGNGNAVAQQFKYNGKELDESLGLNMYDYGKRNYDPSLGRWFVVDALADDENQIDKSPYAYSWNSPISLNDPDGNCPWCIGALVGAITDYAVQVAINVAEGKGLGDALTDIDGGSILLSAAAGAVGVGIGSSISKLSKVGKLANVATKSKTGKAAIEATANVTGDAISSAAGSAIQGNEITVEGVVADIVGGQAGRTVGKNVKNAAQNSSKGKALKKQANRSKRLASGDNSKQSRVNKAAKSENKSTSFGNAKAASAAAVSSNATSKTVNAVSNTMSNSTESSTGSGTGSSTGSNDIPQG